MGFLKNRATGAFIEVRVVRDIAIADVERAESSWRPERNRLSGERRDRGRVPEHAHWDWSNKINPAWAAQWRFVAIASDDQIEGMMAVRTKPRAGRLSPKMDSVLFVDFVEVAPWNSRDLTETPRYSGVGTLLVTEAVRISVELGLKGRIGLSALPQATGFYSRLGMILVESGDPEYGDLAYFEFDEPGSARLLAISE